MFSNSLAFKNANVNALVNDIIYVYNSIVEKGESIYISGHEDDPLKLLV